MVGPHRIAYRDQGAGEPVLLVHSGGFTSRQWKKLIDALAPSFRVVAPDLLGYGASTPWPPKTPFRASEDVAVLKAVLDAVGGSAHLIGHSYGGYLAMQLALERPEAVRTLAVYEPVSFGVLTPEEHADVTSALPGTEPDEAWLEQFVEWWNGKGAWRALNEETRNAFRAVAWKVMQEVLSLASDRTPLEAYAKISAPTLFMAGAATRPVELLVTRRLAEGLPNAKLELFPAAGHMGPITHAPLINAAIARHLQQSGKSSGTTP